jgi:hypothetical protein
MATIGNYPDGVGTAGPYISRLIDVPIDYAVTRYEFEDGGVEVNVQPCGIRRWQLDYEGLSTSDLATLTTHFNNAKGRVNDFSFYHRRAATTYSGVKYVSLDLSPRAKNWSNGATVILEALQ